MKTLALAATAHVKCKLKVNRAPHKISGKIPKIPNTTTPKGRSIS
jgi:hypothetical protein